MNVDFQTVGVCAQRKELHRFQFWALKVFFCTITGVWSSEDLGFVDLFLDFTDDI